LGKQIKVSACAVACPVIVVIFCHGTTALQCVPFTHHSGDAERSTYSEWMSVGVLFLIWHILKAWLCSLSGLESFRALLVGKKSKQPEAGKFRHTQLHVVRTFGCVCSLLLTSCLMLQHWDETWDQWFGQHTADLDARHTVQPVWVAIFALSYYISDMIFICDYPAYYFTHHVVSILAILTAMVVPELRFMGMPILWCAEVGAFMMSVYLKFKTTHTLILFCAVYGASRVLFTAVAWQLCISNYKSPRISDDFAAVMGILLLIINWGFWLTWVAKLRAKLREGVTATHKWVLDEEEFIPPPVTSTRFSVKDLCLSTRFSVKDLCL
jgi:hypothetical protein